MQTIKNIKLIHVLLLSSLVLFVSGCGDSLNKANTNYAAAEELPPLKFPPRSLTVSTRYDIPPISGDKEQIITEIVPPDF